MENRSGEKQISDNVQGLGTIENNKKDKPFRTNIKQMDKKQNFSFCSKSPLINVALQISATIFSPLIAVRSRFSCV